MRFTTKKYESANMVCLMKASDVLLLKLFKKSESQYAIAPSRTQHAGFYNRNGGGFSGKCGQFMRCFC